MKLPPATTKIAFIAIVAIAAVRIAQWGNAKLSASTNKTAQKAANILPA